MPLKDGELQSVAVGLLYLMRTGVVFEDITMHALVFIFSGEVTGCV
jgi:hypothetical protein